MVIKVSSSESAPHWKPLRRRAKVKYAMLGWMIGLPVPIVLILLFYRGCDF